MHFMAKGVGRVVFGPSSQCDLSSLTPLDYGDAFYMECSYSEGYAEIAYDYLAQGDSYQESSKNQVIRHETQSARPIFSYGSGASHAVK